MNCLTCNNTAQRFALPPREHVASDDHWRVAHAFGTGTPGWLVLAPLRHVTAIADLTDAEAALLGTWQVRLSRALHAVTGCAKTYVAQFAEAEGHAHVHFHVIPRMPDHPDELRGPRVFGRLGRPDADDLTPAHRDELAVRIRRELTRPR
ncbi:HIT family protein [Spirillospora sp. NPDC052242]